MKHAKLSNINTIVTEAFMKSEQLKDILKQKQYSQLTLFKMFLFYRSANRVVESLELRNESTIVLLWIAPHLCWPERLDCNVRPTHSSGDDNSIESVPLIQHACHHSLWRHQ